MQLSEFLVHLLEAHAQSLSRLAAFFGEDEFVEMLESADEDRLQSLDSRFPLELLLETPDPRAGVPQSSAYQRLEGAVQGLGLPATLEFHLWAYPFYRILIEGTVDLTSKLRDQGEATVVGLVDEAVEQAAAWIKSLPVPPSVSPAAESAAQIPWVRFRTTVLIKAGHRPLGAVGALIKPH